MFFISLLLSSLQAQRQAAREPDKQLREAFAKKAGSVSGQGAGSHKLLIDTKEHLFEGSGLRRVAPCTVAMTQLRLKFPLKGTACTPREHFGCSLSWMWAEKGCDGTFLCNGHAVSCGDGTQPVRWLANVGVTRYDDAQGRSLGVPIGVRLEDGTLLGLGQSISEAGIQDLQHVHVVLKGQGKPSKGQHASLDELDDE